MNNSSRIAFWLLPAADDERWLQSLIEELARRYDAPAFQPHVTIHAGRYAERPPPETLTARLVEGVAPFSLSIAGTSHSNVFTRTLYFALEPHPSLATLAARAEAAAGGGTAPAPHISLLYASITSAERAAAARSLRPERGVVRFDRVRAVRIGGRTAARADVEAWVALAERPLPSAAG